MKNDLVPDKFRKYLVNLDSLDLNGFALKTEFFVQLIEDSSFDRIAILGGDVLTMKPDGSLDHTYESWSAPSRQPTLSFEDYCLKCKEAAYRYLKIMRKGDDVYISPVLSDQVTAGLSRM